MTKIKSMSILVILLTGIITLTGFSGLNVEVGISGTGEITQDDPPPTQPAPEVPEVEQPESGDSNQSNRIYIQLPGDDDSSTSTQYFGAGLTLGCLIGLVVIIILLIGLFVGRRSKDEALPPTTTSSVDQSQSGQM